MDSLNVAPQFQQDVNYKCRHFERVGETNSATVGEPFFKSIKHLAKVSRLQSPMQKLEQVYSCFTDSIPKEVTDFWQGWNVPAQDLAIDTNSMQSLVIFVVSRANNPQLIAEVNIVETFLPENVRRSNRFIYFEFLSAACTFLLDQVADLAAFKQSCLDSTQRESRFFDCLIPMNQSIDDIGEEQSSRNTMSPQTVVVDEGLDTSQRTTFTKHSLLLSTYIERKRSLMPKKREL